MKKYLFLLLASAIVFTGCDKNSVDGRDAFVGTYEYVTEGEMTFSIFLPDVEPTLPLETEGTFKIEKLGAKDSVLVTGAMDGKLAPFKGIVKGSKLEFVQTDFNAQGKTFEVVMNIDNKVATLANDTLTWSANNVTCHGKFYGVEIKGDGHITMKASKVRLK